MTDTELFQFMDVFKGVARVFPKRMDEHDLSQLGASYFKAMRRFLLPQVAAGAEVWMQQGKFFPKPSEWIESIPRAGREHAEVQALSASEAAEHQDAERRHYDGDPCRCAECREAGVDHRFVRFVPQSDALGRDIKGQIGEHVVTRGRWIHGYELARWYTAKEAFWALFDRGVAVRTMPAVDLAAVTADVSEDYTERLLGEK